MPQMRAFWGLRVDGKDQSCFSSEQIGARRLPTTPKPHTSLRRFTFRIFPEVSGIIHIASHGRSDGVTAATCLHDEFWPETGAFATLTSQKYGELASSNTHKDSQPLLIVAPRTSNNRGYLHCCSDRRTRSDGETFAPRE